MDGVVGSVNKTELSLEKYNDFTSPAVLDIIDKSKAGDKITVTFVNAKGKTSTVTAVLKANIGESSYTTTETTPLPNNDSSNSQGGAFDFPFGE